MKKVCAWCGETMSGEGDEVSHGICPECVKANFPELSGVWASCVPAGSAYIPQFRHLFDGEEKLWGSAGITSRCNLNFTLDRALVFIGGISVPKSREPCPECLESLNLSEVIA